MSHGAVAPHSSAVRRAVPCRLLSRVLLLRGERGYCLPPIPTAPGCTDVAGLPDGAEGEKRGPRGTRVRHFVGLREHARGCAARRRRRCSCPPSVTAFRETPVEAGHDSVHPSSGEIRPSPCRKVVLNSKLPFQFLMQGAVLTSQNFNSAVVVPVALFSVCVACC